MSKAFDTIDRGTLLQDLRDTLLPKELHPVKIMIEDVQLVIHIGQNVGKTFHTNIGTPHCVSPLLFTLY